MDKDKKKCKNIVKCSTVYAHNHQKLGEKKANTFSSDVTTQTITQNSSDDLHEVLFGTHIPKTKRLWPSFRSN
jgi:hypothetical protein